MKRCSKCGENKEFSEFYKTGTKKDRICCWCKKCWVKNSKENRKKRRAKRLFLYPKKKKQRRYLTRRLKELALKNIRQYSFKAGKEHPNWKGGISQLRNKHSFADKKYINWRKAVFERDNYTCQDCKARSGNGKEVYLEAHHLKEWIDYPELRFEVSNGLTLCKDCHNKTKNPNKWIKKRGVKWHK